MGRQLRAGNNGSLIHCLTQDIESLFLEKGMKGGTGGDLSARKTLYVYIY
jgi:hypothetical protein